MGKFQQMENTASERHFVIVDEYPLRGAGLESILSAWAEKEGLKIRSVGSFEKVIRAENVHFEMCLLNLGGECLSDARSWEIFCAIKKKCSPQPVVVLLDIGIDADVRLAYLGGASGLICSSMRPEVVVAALSFILSGGEYFPPIGWRESAKENVQESFRWPIELPPVEPSEMNNRNPGLSIGYPAQLRDRSTAFEPPVDLPAVLTSVEPVPNENCLTKRQDDVLELVKLGRSNKEIARSLNLSESTVKIHVRQLMKKMGVANRTQVALRATRSGQSMSGL